MSAAQPHRLKIRGDDPHGWAYRVELDGKELLASEVSFTVKAAGMAEATITLPLVMLDVESNAITSLVAPILVKHDGNEARPEARRP